MKLWEYLKMKFFFRFRKENCDSKKSAIKNSNGISNIGDGNYIAGGDINVLQENNNAMKREKAWGNFTRLFSDNCINYHTTLMEDPKKLLKERTLEKWKTNIKEPAQELPVSYKDPSAQTLLKIVQDACDAIDSYMKTKEKENLCKKFTNLYSLLANIRNV